MGIPARREEQMDLPAIPQPDAPVSILAVIERAAVLETAARRLANGSDSSPTYVLKMCEAFRAAIAKAEGGAS